MKIRDIMTREVQKVDKDERLGTVLDLMARKGHSKLPVTEGDRLVGVITDGDIVDELGALRNRGMTSTSLHVTAAMRRDVAALGPDDSVEDALKLLKANTLGIVPVVEDGMVVGVVTPADLLDYVKADVPLREFMVKELYAVGPRDRVVHARRVMLDHNVERVPVLDGGRLIGILGEMDLARGYAKFKDTFPTQVQNQRLKDFYVADVMNGHVVTASADLTAKEAAKRMRDEDVGSLPVVDPTERIEGMITRSDLLPFVHL